MQNGILKIKKCMKLLVYVKKLHVEVAWQEGKKKTRWRPHATIFSCVSLGLQLLK